MKETARERKYLSIECPDLLMEWDFEKNKELCDVNTVTAGSPKKVWWKCKHGHEWTERIVTRVVRKNHCPYCTGNKILSGTNDLKTIFPAIAAEWNYKKNEDLLPETMFPKSGKRVWWKCKHGHEWEATIIDRTSQKGACPYCSGLKPIPGVNDFATLRPDLMKEWHYEKNTKVSPNTISLHSNKKVWWKCSLGHEWQAIVNNRVSKNYKCPYCMGVKVFVGFNDLKTNRPDLANEWNYEKNTDFTPETVTVKSGRKVWWKCKYGHEWEAVIAHRANGTGCPICHSAPIAGYNDLQTKNPALAKEWNHEKNGILLPSDVTAFSAKKVWWKCNKLHEWQATVANRSNGKGCPICSNKQVLAGYNDLQTKNPALAKEWNYEKNKDLLPSDVTTFSTKKVWWKCKTCGHEWQAIVANRSVKTGCPSCERMIRPMRLQKIREKRLETINNPKP